MAQLLTYDQAILSPPSPRPFLEVDIRDFRGYVTTRLRILDNVDIELS